MPAIGTVWRSGTWSDDAWADFTWSAALLSEIALLGPITVPAMVLLFLAVDTTVTITPPTAE